MIFLQNIKVLSLREDLKLLYFGEKSSLTDCFIIATGNSNPHIKALQNNVEKNLKENQIEVFSKDRFQPSGWLVIDAIDFVVHIFSSEQLFGRKNMYNEVNSIDYQPSTWLKTVL